MRSTIRPLILASIVISSLISGTALAHKKTVPASDLSITDTSTLVYNSPDSLSIGQNRLIVRAENELGQVYGGPDIPVTLTLKQDTTTIELPTHWVWTSVGYSGFYVANVVFKTAGQWQAILSGDNGASQQRYINVATHSAVPAVGQMAIASTTKVLNSTTSYNDLTTDDNPDPAFYSQSISDAVASGSPSVIIFATPDLCRTAVCGPLLEQMKDLSKRITDVNFVHVEVYEPVKRTNNKLVPVQAVIDWQLPSEPWVFIVDSEGRIDSKFEGYITAEEIESAL